MIAEVERALLDGIAALETLEVRYALVGGLAVSVWGAPRATRDVDLYADLEGAQKQQVQQELEAHGFEVPAMTEELRQYGVFRSRSRQDGIFLDISPRWVRSARPSWSGDDASRWRGARSG